MKEAKVEVSDHHLDNIAHVRRISEEKGISIKRAAWQYTRWLCSGKPDGYHTERKRDKRRWASSLAYATRKYAAGQVRKLPGCTPDFICKNACANTRGRFKEYCIPAQTIWRQRSEEQERIRRGGEQQKQGILGRIASVFSR